MAKRQTKPKGYGWEGHTPGRDEFGGKWADYPATHVSRKNSDGYSSTIISHKRLEYMPEPEQKANRWLVVCAPLIPSLVNVAETYLELLQSDGIEDYETRAEIKAVQGILKALTMPKDWRTVAAKPKPAPERLTLHARQWVACCLTNPATMKLEIRADGVWARDMSSDWEYFGTVAYINEHVRQLDKETPKTKKGGI